MEVKDLTASAGAVPAEKEGQVPATPTGDIKDGKKMEANADPSPEVVLDTEGKPLPWDKQPKWIAARQAEKTLQTLLKANDLEDVDDLVTLVESGKVVKGKLADLNQLDELTTKAAKLDQYEAYWKQQEELQRRDGEAPDETIKRLDRELKAKNNAETRKKAEQAEQEEAKKALGNFDREVTALIKGMDVPEEHQGIFLELCGVGNQANDIDITDRKAIKKMVADSGKKFEALKQAIIADYLKGKEVIPKVGAVSGAAPVGEKQAKTMLKDARKGLHEWAARALSGG